MPFLAQVRRMEAVGFRSFPSTSTYYDGTWAIRLTAGHPAKRLNSVNPLDPSDHAYVDARLAHARDRFDGFGRPLVFRQSPLAPAELETLLDKKGWERFDESIVMMLDLNEVDLSFATDMIPTHDIGSWVSTFLGLSNEAVSGKPGLVEIISSIEPITGLFSRSVEGTPACAVRCVRDNDLAGIFDLVTGEALQRQGHARALVGTVLKWAKMSGARFAWLQVAADNEAALELYSSFGFFELYRYRLQKAPDTKLGCVCTRLKPKRTLMDKPILLVSACAVVDADNRVLIAQRPEGKSMAGLWEFPGGKVEAGETPEQTLIRELAEELGITTWESCLAPLSFASHSYDDFHLLMPLFVCRKWDGTPVSRENQALKWVRAQRLREYDMPPADEPLIPALTDLL